jgi:hypothetical protein
VTVGAFGIWVTGHLATESDKVCTSATARYTPFEPGVTFEVADVQAWHKVATLIRQMKHGYGKLGHLTTLQLIIQEPVRRAPIHYNRSLLVASGTLKFHLLQPEAYPANSAFANTFSLLLTFAVASGQYRRIDQWTDN